MVFWKFIREYSLSRVAFIVVPTCGLVLCDLVNAGFSSSFSSETENAYSASCASHLQFCKVKHRHLAYLSIKQVIQDLLFDLLRDVHHIADWSPADSGYLLQSGRLQRDLSSRKEL